MSSSDNKIINNIKNIFKRELTNEQRIKAEIESIEFKKATILKGLEEDRAKSDHGIQLLFRRIGSIVYENHLAEVKNYSFEEQFKQIAELREELKEQEDRIADIVDGYNYEISLLESNLGVAAAILSKAEQKGEPCSSCGNLLAPDDRFCNKCGDKREQQLGE